MRGTKICGIASPQALDAAAGAGAGYVGFVFHAASPRVVTSAQAAGLAGRVAVGGPLRVGLFVRPDPRNLAAVLRDVPLDALQLYDADMAAIRAMTELPLWRAIGVATRADLPDDTGGADALVIEAKPPPGADRPGGHGRTIDWAMLRGWDAPVPWMLAGGLTPDNVADAIAASGARAVDVSSGVESAPGVKDPALIAAFLRAARDAFDIVRVTDLSPVPSLKGRGDVSLPRPSP